MFCHLIHQLTRASNMHWWLETTKVQLISALLQIVWLMLWLLPMLVVLLYGKAQEISTLERAYHPT
jgi:hypothetical protein